MKSPQSKNNSANKPAHTPFFQKERGNNFFGKSERSKPFFNSHPIQAKLTIGQPNDIYEKEANSMADKVVQRSSDKFFSNGDNNSKPFFTKSIIPVQLKCSGCEKEEKLQKKSDSSSQVATSNIESSLSSSKGSGSSLPLNTRQQMESSFGVDFSGVRLHNDSAAANMNKDLNAQAFTHGNDIYFSSGKYNTECNEGKHLLAHELAHVVQQQQGIVQRNMIQCDIGASLPTANGIFDFDSHASNGASAIPATTQANLDVSIKFMPDVNAPYSNEIKLFQIIRDRDTAGTDIDIASLPPGRGASLRTTEDAITGVEGGFFTDVLHQDFNAAGPTTVADPGSQKGMAYEGGTPVFGFKRSNDIADIKAAEITDRPGSAGDRNFEFETVAKGEDTNTVYGSLHWAFGTRSGTVINESVVAEDTQSATFDAAAELHRNFYVHEPVVFYFEFDSDVVTAGEANKIDAFLDYLSRFPDVRLSLEGFADRRGNPSYNLDLSLRRADHVREALVSRGVDSSRIDDIIIGSGSTEQFTTGGDLEPNPGQSQDLEANRRGNRRVVLTFEHTVSLPGP